MKQIFAHTTALRSGLESFLAAKRAAATSSVPWQADFLDRLLTFATTGKLLRGNLVCFTYETFAEKPVDESVMKAAMALELTHSALLVHDDIMDNDTLRRGQPSFHQQYASLGVQQHLERADHFGTSMAMCAGDAALFLAFELLAGSPAATVQLFTNQLVATCAGQMQDLYLESGQALPSKKTIYELMETKTAAYTLALPMALGASLADQPRKALEQLQNIGMKAGIIFQIRDDELGIMGNIEETGKPVGSDITEGKKTLVQYYLLQACTPQERQRATSIFGNPAITSEDIGYIQTLITRYAIIELLNNEISSLEKQATAIIDDVTVSEKTKKELTELIHFCSQRRS